MNKNNAKGLSDLLKAAQELQEVAQGRRKPISKDQKSMVDNALRMNVSISCKKTEVVIENFLTGEHGNIDQFNRAIKTRGNRNLKISLNGRTIPYN